MGEDSTGPSPHDLDVTVWVGKRGIAPVVDEVAEQLEERGAIKVKFLRAARAGTDTASLAAELADAVDATVVDVRGHTAVLSP